jgi:hypothetical protein
MNSRLHPAVEADLARQAAALSKRVRGSGLYTHEVHEFEVARLVHRRVAPALGLTDLGTLTTPESRNIVRKVRRPDGSTAVLKVIGNLREPGEAEALRAWSAIADSAEASALLAETVALPMQKPEERAGFLKQFSMSGELGAAGPEPRRQI